MQPKKPKLALKEQSMCFNGFRRCAAPNYFRHSSFHHVDDHWEVILALKSAAPCMCIYLEVYRAFRQPVSRKSHEKFVLVGEVYSMHHPYIESATAIALCDDSYNQ